MDLLKKCPKCESKTFIYIGNGCSTATYCTPFIKEGKYHIHDDCNVITEELECENHHQFVLKTYDECPSCDYNKDKSKLLYLGKRN